MSQKHNPEHTSETTVPVVEEQLHVSRREVDTGRTLRLHKWLEEEPVQLSEPVTLESVEVERVAVGRVVEQAPGVRQEGEVTVVPVVEERLVTRKELVLVEEIRLKRVRKVTEAKAEAVVRRERVDVERFDPESRQWHPEAKS